RKGGAVDSQRTQKETRRSGRHREILLNPFASLAKLLRPLRRGVRIWMSVDDGRHIRASVTGTTSSPCRPAYTAPDVVPPRAPPIETAPARDGQPAAHAGAGLDPEL